MSEPKPVTLTLAFADAFTAVTELRLAAKDHADRAVALREAGVDSTAFEYECRAEAVNRIADEITAASVGVRS
jgi:hypothetical protein